MANDERERALAAIAERYVDDAYDAGQARAEQLERELAEARKSLMRVAELELELEVMRGGRRQLQSELAAERERAKKLEQRVSDLKFALGDGAGWFDRYRAERAELQRCREAVRRALVYLTDKDDVESTPHHAIGHAVHELRALSAAPPAEVQQAQRENATLGADNERLCKELLEADNARREGRQLLQRFVKYAREDEAVTPGFTRLERLTEQVADYLRRSNNPRDILRGDEPCLQKD